MNSNSPFAERLIKFKGRLFITTLTFHTKSEDFFRNQPLSLFETLDPSGEYRQRKFDSRLDKINFIGRAERGASHQNSNFIYKFTFAERSQGGVKRGGWMKRVHWRRSTVADITTHSTERARMKPFCVYARDNYCIFNISLCDKRSAINSIINNIKPFFPEKKLS